MNWKLFVAQRIYRSREGEKEVSKPAVLIARWGIAIGLAVMIVAVAVVVGFKHEVRDKIIGFGSHIQVSNYYESDEQGELPVTVNAKDLEELASVDGIAKVQTFVSKTVWDGEGAHVFIFNCDEDHVRPLSAQSGASPANEPLCEDRE